MNDGYYEFVCKDCGVITRFDADIVIIPDDDIVCFCGRYIDADDFSFVVSDDAVIGG